MEKLEEAYDGVIALGSKLINETRDWDGTGKGVRLKAAFMAGSATKPERAHYYRENLRQVYASIEDLTRLQQCQREFYALAIQLTSTHPRPADRRKRWWRKR